MSDSLKLCQRPGCVQSAPLRCGSCKSVSYCSVDCQKTTWKRHKQLCTAVTKSATSPANSCLILDGMGPLGSDDINTKPLVMELTSTHNMQVSVVHLDDGFVTAEQIAAALDQGRFSTCIILGWGSGEVDIGDVYGKSDAFRSALVSWVGERGGRLIVHGERISYAAGDWPTWFGLTWKSSDYCRTTHMLNPNHWFRQHAPYPTMNVKACLVTCDNRDDILFGPDDGAVTYSIVPGFGGRPVSTGQAAIALSKFGRGTVSFFGDVNCEETTIKTVGCIAATSVSSS
jgi:hypothetical protein